MTETDELREAVLQLAGAVEVIRQGISGLPSGTAILSHEGSQRPHLATVSDRLTAISIALPEIGSSAWLAPIQKRAGISPEAFASKRSGEVNSAIDAVDGGAGIEVTRVRNFVVLEDGYKFLLALDSSTRPVNIFLSPALGAELIERIQAAQIAAGAARMAARDRDTPDWKGSPKP